MMEYWPKASIPLSMDSGKKEKNILEPSSGGMGTRLNIASAKFTTMMAEIMK